MGPRWPAIEPRSVIIIPARGAGAREEKPASRLLLLGLAQPGALFPDQPLLHRSVVLVLEHSEASGTIGLLLDRPSNRTVGHLLQKRKPFLKVSSDMHEPRNVQMLLLLHLSPCSGALIETP